MMTVSDKGINTELKYEELRILEALLSERESEMMGDIDNKDRHKFLELLQLKAKINGMTFLVDHEIEVKKNSNRVKSVDDIECPF